MLQQPIRHLFQFFTKAINFSFVASEGGYITKVGASYFVLKIAQKLRRSKQAALS